MGGIALKSPHFGQGKRRRLVFEDRDCHYHAISRVAGGELLFGDVEKEAFRKLMRRLEKFCCVGGAKLCGDGESFPHSTPCS